MYEATMNKQNKTILNYALDYHKLGFCVIPIKPKSKEPAIKWKKYETQRPTEKQLKKWFSNNHNNIAVMMGKISGHLSCRDFDDAEGIKAYESWAKANPELAKVLPTAKTPNGYHVYFRCKEQTETFEHLPDGELRVSRCYCLLPPSKVVDKKTKETLSYEWIIKPDGQIHELDPKDTNCLCLSASDVTERTERVERTEENRENIGDRKKENITQVTITDKIKQAIARTLPLCYGTRHHKIFEFARELKSMPEYTDADPHAFRLAVEKWFKRALPNIRTKDFEETWIDFLKGWPEIKCKIGENPMAKIFEKAIQLEPPKIAVEKYPENKKLQFLASLCRELQRAAGDNPFFLACRTASRLLSGKSQPVSSMAISRWLFLLKDDGIITVVVPGGTKENPRKATRYRYIGD